MLYIHAYTLTHTQSRKVAEEERLSEVMESESFVYIIVPHPLNCYPIILTQLTHSVVINTVHISSIVDKGVLFMLTFHPPTNATTPYSSLSFLLSLPFSLSLSLSLPPCCRSQDSHSRAAG